MKKPEHQWQTRLHRAVRLPQVPHDRADAFADDPRAEAFTLRFDGGPDCVAIVGLRRQEVGARAAKDPDLAHAVRCWLVARGVRTVALDGPGGPLDHGSIDVDALGSEAALGRRVITLAPSNAEVVDALGVFDRVVACEDSSDHPPAITSLPRLGPDLGPDLDRVVELRPDVVISSLAVPGMERVVTGLRARGVPQVVLAPRSVDDVLLDVRRVARVLDVEAAGNDVIGRLESERRSLRAACPRQPCRVYLEWWPKPMFTPGAHCYSNELIALAGGRNVFADRAASSVQIEAAEVVAADPDVCFVSWCGVAEAKLDPRNLIEREGLQALRAAKAGRVFRLDEAFSGRPGPRMLEASRRMAAAIATLG